MRYLKIFRLRAKLKREKAGWQWGWYFGRGINSFVRGGVATSFAGALLLLVRRFLYSVRYVLDYR